MNITGLTERQVELLDTMWAWMATLSRSERVEAESLQRLVVLEAFEELLEKGKYPDANMVIDKIRKL